MKNLLLILIFLFPYRVLFAQGDFTRIYHPIINSAELAIVDTNYYEALDYYKAAFDNVKKPFAKDYYNAAICAAMVGKMSTVFDYLEKIVEKGYPSDSLRKDVFFHYVADTCKTWSKFEGQMKQVKPNINRELRDSLNKIYALSTKTIYTPLTADLREYFAKNHSLPQTFTTKINGKDTTIAVRVSSFVDSLYFFNNLSGKLKLQQDSLRKINNEIFSKNQHLVYNSIVKIIENNGYPDENLIGLSGRDSQNSSKDRRIFYFAEQNFNNSMLNSSIVLDIFSSSFPAEESDIKGIITQAVRDGKLLPHHVNRVNASRGSFRGQAVANNTNNELNVFSFGKVRVYRFQLEANLKCAIPDLEKKLSRNYWQKESLQEYSEAEINEKRLDIGLETLADAYKKAFFKAYPRVFIINGGSYQSELSYVSSCEVLEKMLKENTFVR
ncbi:hypothetical protein GCM10011514_43830 [Emticicia aquatilis]|uniref:Uncharacterized protein n=1 Tax=Emticicia aquatilis TaxID=1537369 RepID=A0A916Z3U3_9BACT|nr:hypothetical protein [Emticicia aquatilis]GGD75044.1 hypothetical protein GCM10011514_43830 [Emticicia aquatilis]